LSGVVAALLLGAFVSRVDAQFDATAVEPVERLGGALLLHGGGGISGEVRGKFMELAGGSEARIVVIPTADPEDPLDDDHLRIWRELGPKSLVRLHADTREQAMQPAFVEPLREATAIWISGGRQSRLAQTYADSPVERAVIEVVRRGGVVGGSSAGAAIASRVMLVRGELRQGFDLLPGAIVDQHFLARNRQSRLMDALAAARDRFGVGIDENTALLLRGRRLEVIGESTVTVCLPPTPRRPAATRELKAGDLADYLALSRAALERSREKFPPAAPPPPRLDKGTLIIVGGGGIPAGTLQRFIDDAGGPEAPLVYIPCEEREMLVGDPDFVGVLRRAGATNVQWIHTKDRRRANQDETLLAPLRTAKGIWFGGGRQWNLVDSYQNTCAHRLMHEVLQRGGVIGGSSAGASIQGDYMPRGDPLGNLNIIAEGYEQGLGFLTGVAIDQHFAQRNRFGDMSELISKYPQYLGIGIDESTAIVVKEHRAEVVGKGHVAFYDAGRRKLENQPDYLSLSSGQSYDLVSRSVVATDAGANPPSP
jgi:cyanophycinase